MYRIDDKFDLTEEQIHQYVTEFRGLEADYGERNSLMEYRMRLYEGQHWISEIEEDTEMQLVLNYLRNVVLRMTATLANTAKVTIPVTGEPDSDDARSARAREKLIRVVWDDLMEAWYDVEINASKVGYGVLRTLWDDTDAIGTITQGRGEAEKDVPAYIDNPFSFMSIDPRYFYPIFKNRKQGRDSLMRVYRWDPGRNVEELEETYGVSLQGASHNELGTDKMFSQVDSADLIEIWTKDKYCLIALTLVEEITERRGAGNRQAKAEKIKVFTVLQSGKNPYKEIPFYILQNIRSDPNADPTFDGSMSDMDDISSINLHLNEMASEEAEEIKIKIHAPVVYKSDDHSQDPADVAYGAGKVIPIGLEEDAMPMDWRGHPGTVESHMARMMTTIRDLSFLGGAGFGNIESGASGIAFKIAMTPLQQLVELKIPLRIQVLKDVAGFIFRCYRMKSKKDYKLKKWIFDQVSGFSSISVEPGDIGSDTFVHISYSAILPRDDIAEQQHLVYLYKTGAISLRAMLEKLNIDDPEQEIQRIKRELLDPVLNPERVMMYKELGLDKDGNESEQPSEAEQHVPTGALNGPRVALPGTAQNGTNPLDPNSIGGMRQTAPTTVNQQGPVPLGQENQPMNGLPGAGALAPFMNRDSAGQGSLGGLPTR